MESIKQNSVLSKNPPTTVAKPINTGHQSNSEEAETLDSPQETSEDGSHASSAETNSMMWSVFWLIFATLLIISATPSLRETLAFGQKLQKAKSGDRYDKIDSYNALQDDSKTDTEGREQSYAQLVNSYYDLATEFYEWGWGTSFHFADRRKGESFHSSILRHETYLAGRLGVKKGAKVLDCGCGVGGPARNISSFTGAHVTGITINQFQVDRGNTLSVQQGAADRVKLVQGDFMKLPFEDNSFDAVYAIEATCHAPDRVGVYSEILRVLKPGGIFATYEWCLTDKYSADNSEHRWIKKAIEEGDGLPDMCHTSVCTKAVQTSGFELIEARDAAEDGHPGGDPWYRPLTPSWKPWVLPGFQFNPVVFRIFPVVLRALEAIRVVPTGTSKTQVMLQAGGIGCERGGATGIFTPMWLMVGRKPEATK
jgi:sterol 24-C-methyltransferase